MKRISIAEQTLQKQIDRIERDIREHMGQIDTHNAVVKELRNQGWLLECERDLLRTARERKSK